MNNPRTRIARHHRILKLGSKPSVVEVTGTVADLELGARASHASANPAYQFASAQYERLVCLLKEGHVPPS